MLTLRDVIDRLKQLDEISLLEVLNITSEEIVQAFEERIEERYDYLRVDLEDDEGEEY